MTSVPALHDFRGRKVGVLGLARSGLAAAQALSRVGAEVLAFDDRPEAIAAAEAVGARSGSPGDIASLVGLVVSPGVPLDLPAPHPVVVAARTAAVPILGDVDIFAATWPDLPIVGVTGTNGKSTTTALIHHLLVRAGRKALLGGNIGRAVFDLPPPRPGELAVLELSSYQLELSQGLRCRVAAWLNLTPDHLDRHGDMARYAAAKARIFAHQGPEDVAVVGMDDEPSQAMAESLRRQGRRVVSVAVGQPVESGVAAVDGVLLDGIDGAPRAVLDLAGHRALRGRHNHQNAAVAYAVVRCLGLAPAEAAAGFADFTGLPHRMEVVGEVAGVLFVNDSKATNPEAATKSLAAFEDIFWIAGGLPKPGGFAELLPFLGGVRRAFLIGKAADEIATALAGRVPVDQCGNLAAAIEQAFSAARESRGRPVVLLAPACASFDQFRSYEHRGDAFRAAVAELASRALVHDLTAAEVSP